MKKKICMTLIHFIYDHHLFWFNIHTVISQHASLSGDISLQLAAIHVVLVSLGILKGAMHPCAQGHLDEYFATSHYLKFTFYHNPNQVQHIMFGISNVHNLEESC